MLIRHIKGFVDQHRFLRFVIVGVFNSLFSFMVYGLLIAVLGTPTWLALIAGNIAGISFNFLSTGGLVFRQLSLSLLPRFIGCYLAVYSLNLSLIKWSTTLIASPIWSQAILTLPLALLSYLLLSRFVFDRNSR